MPIIAKKTRGGRPRKSDARTKHLTVALSDAQLQFCAGEAGKRGLMGRGDNKHEPSPGRFIAVLIAENMPQKITEKP